MKQATLIDRLIREHRAIEAGFDAVDAAEVHRKPGRLRDLVRSIVQHEVAEEVVVFPAADGLSLAGRQVHGARLEEQAHLDRQLVSLKQLELGTDEFEALFREVEQEFLTHAYYEERTVLKSLRESTTDEELEAMDQQYVRTKLAVPSDPYPLGATERDAPTAARRALLQMLRRIRDRAGDAA